jgi:DNA-binding IclR family transcriptional regulator
VLLADMADYRLKTFLSSCKYERRTSHTITNAKDFMHHITQVRKQGYAINDQESEMGMRGIAVSIKNRHGQASAAISLSGPTIRLSMEKLLATKDELTACAEGITESLYG